MNEAELERFRRIQAAVDLAKFTPFVMSLEEAENLLKAQDDERILMQESIIRWGSESPMFPEIQLHEIKQKAKKNCDHEWIATKLLFTDVYDCKHCKIKREDI